MKSYSTLFPVLTLAATLWLPVSAQAGEFFIEENFDSYVVEERTPLPEGWQFEANGSHDCFIQTGTYFGVTAASGSNVAGVVRAYNGDVLYTPGIEMKGGTPATVTFSVLAPGSAVYPAHMFNVGLNIYAGAEKDVTVMESIGNVDGNIPEWTEYSFVYTPETDGTYYFAIESSLYQRNFDCGKLLLDSFTFEGTAPDGGDTADLSELMPDAANMSLCQDLPYEQIFSNADEYPSDGSSYVPLGWITAGDNIWRTASWPTLPAREGEWYLISPETGDGERNEVAFTPFFDMTAGIEYTVRFYTHVEGTEVAEGVWRNTKLNLLLATQQDLDFPYACLATIDRMLDESGEWVLSEIKFTPVNSGAYTFGLQLEGPEMSGWIALDHFQVLEEGMTPRPVARIGVTALHSLYTDDLVAFEKVPVRFTNLSENAESCEWEAEGCTVNVLPDGDADIIFPASGTYQIRLTATNARGSREAVNNVNVSVVNELAGSNDALMNYCPGDCKVYDRGAVPAFDTDELDFITGFNHYYRKIAERYTVPAPFSITPNSFSMFITDRRFRNATASGLTDQTLEPLTVAIYGADEEGNLDESKVLYSHTAPMKEIIETQGLGSISSQGQDIAFNNAGRISGTFYITLEYSENLDVDPQIEELGRSYIAHSVVRNNTKVTNLYVKPEAVPETATVQADGKWYPVDALDAQYAGFGNNWILWADINGTNTGVALNNMGDVVFAARFIGDCLQVSGTAEGEWIAVYDMSGKCVAQAKAEDRTAEISVNLPAGIYVVCGNSGTAKVIR